MSVRHAGTSLCGGSRKLRRRYAKVRMYIPTEDDPLVSVLLP
jgi:hypothetical protein